MVQSDPVPDNQASTQPGVLQPPGEAHKTARLARREGNTTMATSRTGLAPYLHWRKRVLAAGRSQGVMHCSVWSGSITRSHANRTAPNQTISFLEQTVGRTPSAMVASSADAATSYAETRCVTRNHQNRLRRSSQLRSGDKGGTHPLRALSLVPRGIARSLPVVFSTPQEGLASVSVDAPTDGRCGLLVGTGAPISVSQPNLNIQSVVSTTAISLRCQCRVKSYPFSPSES